MNPNQRDNVRGGHDWFGGPHWVRVVFVRLPIYLTIGFIVYLLPSWFRAVDTYRESPLGWEAESVLEHALAALLILFVHWFVRFLSWSYASIRGRRFTPWTDCILEVSPTDRPITTGAYALMCVGPFVGILNGPFLYGPPIAALGALTLGVMAVRVIVFDAKSYLAGRNRTSLP